MKYNDDYQNAISMLLAGSVDIAVKKLEVLSKKGNGHADSVLGNIYEFGKGSVTQDQNKALSYYESSVSTSGSVQALLGIARITLDGDSALRDYERSRQCLDIVANDTNYPQAWLHLGRIYAEGLGVEIDTALARSCYEKAAFQGNILGYTGLGKVAFAERRIFKAIYFRVIAVVKAMRRIVSGDADHDSLKQW